MTENRHKDELIPFLARHALAGVLAGWIFFGLIIYFNVARIGELLATSDDWFLTIILGGAGFAVTFGSLSMGTAIFLLPRK